MRYTVRKSVVRILGGIWLPYGTQCAQEKELSKFDVDNLRNEDGSITRESVSDWVDSHSSDFSSVTDWWASIEDGETTLEFDWQNEDSEPAWLDAMYGCECE